MFYMSGCSHCILLRDNPSYMNAFTRLAANEQSYEASQISAVADPEFMKYGVVPSAIIVGFPTIYKVVDGKFETYVGNPQEIDKVRRWVRDDTTKA